MPVSHNLALKPATERMAMAADLIARRLMFFRKNYPKTKQGAADWKRWGDAEILKLSGAYQQPVKDRINALMGLVK